MSAQNSYPYFDSFKFANAPEVVLDGIPPYTATLTAATGIDPDGAGYLRLTVDGIANQSVFARHTRSFSSINGLDITFEYYTYGSLEQADGINFFLYDATADDPPNSFNIGGFGGSLGYAQRRINPTTVNPGVKFGFIGIGIDEFGSFSTTGQDRQGGVVGPGFAGAMTSSVTLRGDGDGNSDKQPNYTVNPSTFYASGSNYEFLRNIQTTSQTAMDNVPVGNGPTVASAGTAFEIAGNVDGRNLTTGGPQGLDASDRGYRKARVLLEPNGSGGFIVDVWITEGDPLGLSAANARVHHVINKYVYTPTAPIPPNLSYGFSASTGGSNSTHEIRAIDIVVPASTELPPILADIDVTTSEDQNVVLTSSHFTTKFLDPNGFNTLSKVYFPVLPSSSQGVIKLNNGTTDVDITANQQILIADIVAGRLKFVPAANFHGSTTGIKWNGYDNSTVGPQLTATTAEDLNITVTSVNDAPSGASNSISIIPTTVDHVLPASYFGFTDPVDNSPSNTLSAVRISTLPSSGILELNNVAITAGQSISVANLNSNLLTYTPGGTGTTSFTFQVQDNGSTANGGVDLDPSPKTLTIHVAPVPTITLSNSNPQICFATATTGLLYTGTTGAPKPNRFSIDWDGATNTAGIPDVAETVFDGTTGGTLSISGLASIPSGTYNGVLTVRNSGNSITSVGVPVVLTISALPVVASITGFGDGKICVGNTRALGNTTTGGIWSSSNTGVATVNTSGVVTGVSTGTATITYTVTDATTGCSTAVTTSIQVNALPVVASITGFGDGKLCVGNTRALGNTTTGGVWGSSNTAVATVNTSGVVTGVSTGTATITYTVTDATTGCSTAVTTSIQVNALPVVASTTGFGDGKICVGNTRALGNTTTGGVWGSSNTAVATVNTSGVITGVSTGTATITYTVTDATTGCSTAVTTSIQVNPLPVVGPITGASGTQVGNAIQLANNSAGGVWGSSNTAVATVTPSGLVTGVASGTTIINYTVTTGDCATKVEHTVTVAAVANSAPVSVADAYSVFKGGTISVADPGVLINDTDSDKNTLTAVKVSDPANGTLTLNSNGSFVYKHNGGTSTSDSFTYKANDGTTDGNVVSVSLTINANNTPPSAADDNYSVLRGGTLSIPAPGIITNDSDADGNTLSALKVSNPSSGNVTLSQNGSFTYINNGGTATSDSFTYKLTDGASESSSATVTITITAANSAPVAAADTYNVLKGSTLNVSAPGVLVNDTDIDGQTLTAVRVSNPANGSLTFNSNGSFSYTHNNGTATSDSFTYKVNDGSVDGNTVTVVLNITTTANNAPVAVADTYSVVRGATLAVASPGLLTNDTDPDGNAINAVKVSNPSNGTVTVNSNGSFTYVHNGGTATSDSFGYKVNDGTTDGNITTVTINILPANNPPVSAADSYSVVRGNTLTIAAPGVLSNDTDPEGNALTAVKVSNPSNGTLTLNANGSFTYINNGNASSSDSFAYKVNDGTVDGNTVTVSISISNANALPIIADITKTGNRDQPVTFTSSDFTSKYSDADGDVLNRIRIVTLPASGNLRLNGNNISANQEVPASELVNITYIPVAGFVGGPVSFTWNANDGKEYAASARSVSITIVQVNAAPVTVADAYTVNKSATLTVNLPGILFNDTDAEGNTLTAIKVSDPLYGALTLNSNGSFSYKHNGGTQTSDSFTYKSNDGTTDGNTAVVTITITQINTPPVVSGKEITKIGTGFLPITFTAADFTSAFVDAEGDGLVKVRITTVPPSSTGLLKLNGVVVTSGQEIPTADLAGLAFEPAINWGGTTNFTWNGSDGTAYATTNGNISLTIVRPTDPNAKIGLAKNLSAVTPAVNGTFDVKFTFTAVNYGNFALENVSVRDNLSSAFGTSTVVLKTVSAFGNLKSNPAFDGSTDTQLLLPSSRLEAGEEATIEMVINIKLTAGGGLFYNSATTEAESVVNGFKVSDVSTNGLKPDPNQAGDVSPSESTPIELESQPSFVPGGFSPNGDGTNDKFIIQNADGKQVSLEVYNRWGNRVYRSVDYQNDWGGEVTEGFFVGKDIPDGTYYYIIVIDNTDKYVGFITVNR